MVILLDSGKCSCYVRKIFAGETLMNPDSERKSADRLAFEHYLRTGRRLTTAEWLAEERKFNPYPNPDDGRFTFAPGGIDTSGLSAAMASQRREALSGTHRSAEWRETVS